MGNMNLNMEDCSMADKNQRKGTVTLGSIDTPGHTPESITFLVDKRSSSY